MTGIILNIIMLACIHEGVPQKGLNNCVLSELLNLQEDISIEVDKRKVIKNGK